ncbi:MAG: hypothetical protein M1820_009518 [Bogoriella megaspora]|nr:MAG: hypothetical protein M1820_009518 [Bogoriella megaspora]
MFSPASFPNGVLIYDLSTSFPSISHLALSPFELFREPLMILGLADGTEYASVDPVELAKQETDVDSSQNGSGSYDDLFREMDLLREEYPKVLVHKLLIFDKKPVSSIPLLLPDHVMFVPPVEELKTTTMKTVMCDVTATLLAELTTYARSIQALTTIESPVSPEVTSPSWSDQSTNAIGLENARAAPVPRATSPAGMIDKRMSMPSPFPSSVSERPRSSMGSRPGTPTEGARGRAGGDRELGLPFGRPNGDVGPLGTAARSSAATGLRDSSRDRMSIQGFGSGSISERNRNRGKGRIGIVMGTFYLLAGRWNDALRELVENTNRVQAFSDHIWYAKGVENILVCLLLCAWKGIDFEISSVVSPYGERAPPPRRPMPTPSAGTLEGEKPDPTMEAARHALEKLSDFLPDSLNMIVNIYDRAAANNETLPDNAFSEIIIRISKLLATLHVFSGSLTRDALEALISNAPLESFAPNASSRLYIRPSRRDIAELAYKALPPGNSNITIADRILALAGVASVMSMLGLQRKKAIVVKEYLATFIPALIEARKAGAAELGIHPAAGLSAMSMIGSPNPGHNISNSQRSEHGFKDLLTAIGQVYGVAIPEASKPSRYSGPGPSINGVKTSHDSSEPHAATPDELNEKILQEAFVRSFGNLHLKYDTLRIGLAFCEALPDFDGVLQLSATMLRAAGPATVSGSNASTISVTLAKEEQVRLATNIPRTLGAAKTLNVEGLEADYWDDFLVRAVHVLEPPPSLQTIGHAKSDLDLEPRKQATEPGGPFIYDHLSKTIDKTAAENALVAGDQSVFAVELQNPFEFEVEIDWLKLAIEGMQVDSLEENLVLGPSRIQTFWIAAKIQQPGKLKITGCTVKVTGCRERTFPIYDHSWAPEQEIKLKHIGLVAGKLADAYPASQEGSSKKAMTEVGPIVSDLPVTVIGEQPLLEIVSVSLSQTSIMILEGERQSFTVTVKNVGMKTVVDLLLVHFQDSTIAPLQAAMKNKDVPRPELYELEVQYLRSQALRLLNPDRLHDLIIEPGESVTFDFEVLGKPGLSDGIIQFDYAHLGRTRSEITDRFFTRKAILPLAITVNASIQLSRLDILPFTSNFAWQNQLRVHSQTAAPSPKTPNIRAPAPSAPVNRFTALLDRIGLDNSGPHHCLLLLDLRNAWPVPITIAIDVLSPPTTPSHLSPTTPTPSSSTSPTHNNNNDWPRTYTIHELLHPGHTTRILLVLPKLYIPDPYAPIPILDERNKRQFVRSQGQVSLEAERDLRERFWYRDELLKYVRGRWREEGGMGRTSGGRGMREGELDLRGLRLSRGMLEVLREDDVGVEMVVRGEIGSDDEEGEEKEVVRRLGRSRFEVRVDEFVTVRTKVRNRGVGRIHPMLRLQPRLADQQEGVALDLDRKIAWSGLLQRVLPVLGAGAEVEVDLGFCALCSGEFEIVATVEEVQVLQSEDEGDGSAKGHARARSRTVTLSEDLMKDKGRRVWHASEPCRIVAVEEL